MDVAAAAAAAAAAQPIDKLDLLYLNEKAEMLQEVRQKGVRE